MQGLRRSAFRNSRTEQFLVSEMCRCEEEGLPEDEASTISSEESDIMIIQEYEKDGHFELRYVEPSALDYSYHLVPALAEPAEDQKEEEEPKE